MWQGLHVLSTLSPILWSLSNDLTGSINPETRKELWQGGIKRAFFCTPQTFWNDVKKGEQALGAAALQLVPALALSGGMVVVAAEAGSSGHAAQGKRLGASTPVALQAFAPTSRWCAWWWTSATAPRVSCASRLVLGRASCRLW